MNKVEKKVTLELVGLDGNAFALMGAFKQQARREGWKKEEIDAVINECTSGDYNHLLCTLMEHCKSPQEEYDPDSEDNTEMRLDQEDEEEQLHSGHTEPEESCELCRPFIDEKKGE